MLIHGPPGTGKTTLVKSLLMHQRFSSDSTDDSTKTHIQGGHPLNFISAAGTELIGKIVGESEKRLAALFREARAAAPCALFIDQVCFVQNR